MEQTKRTTPALDIISASEITPTEVAWLWYPFIPYGKVTLLQGDPGDGKSTFVLTLAAMLTNGEPLAAEAKLTETEQQALAAEAKLTETEKQLTAVSQKVEVKRKVAVTFAELEAMGTKGITGRYTVSREELGKLKGLAQEAITSRGEIYSLEEAVGRYQRENKSLRSRVVSLQDKLKDATEKYDHLVEVTKPYLTALQHFPETVKAFFERILSQKQQTEERKQPMPERKSKRKTEWER